MPGRFASSEGKFCLKYEEMPFHSLYVFVYLTVRYFPDLPGTPDYDL